MRRGIWRWFLAFRSEFWKKTAWQSKSHTFKDLQSHFLKAFLGQQGNPGVPFYSVILNLPAMPKYKVTVASAGPGGHDAKSSGSGMWIPDGGHQWGDGVRGQQHKIRFSVTKTVGFSSGSYYCVKKVLILFSHWEAFKAPISVYLLVTLAVGFLED